MELRLEMGMELEFLLGGLRSELSDITRALRETGFRR